jgi:hypothetical protein
VVSQLRMRGSPQGHGDPSAGELALPVSSHRAGADGPPQPVHRVWARVAPRHEQGRRALGEAVPTWCAVGAGKHCVPAPDRRPRRRALAVSWNTVNDAILAEVTQVLIEDPDRFDGVRLIGATSTWWRHEARLCRTLSPNPPSPYPAHRAPD